MMNFSNGLNALKLNERIRRSGWNGKGMWLQLVTADCWSMSSDAIADDSFCLEKSPWIGMRTADNKFVPWLASQTDILAEDWEIV